jgi:hypothetical protein
MISEDALWFKRGDLVEFNLNLGAGKTTCRGIVVNTAVLFGRGARQIWILDMDGGTPAHQAHWTNRKHIVPEEDIISRIPQVVIGADTILRDNPVSFPVQEGAEVREISAVTVTIAVPTPLIEQSKVSSPEVNPNPDSDTASTGS